MNDELDEEIIGAEDGFDEFAQKTNLGDAIRQSPVLKIGVVVVGLVLVAGVAYLFGGEAQEEKNSFMSAGSDVTSVPGEEGEASPAYIEAIEQQNQEELELAIKKRESVIPIPVPTSDTRLEIPEEEEEVEDPLHRWRMLQDERVEREMKRQEIEAEPVTVLNAEQQNESIQRLSQSMTQQMQKVLGANNENQTFTTNTYITYNDINAEGGAAAGAGGAGAPGGFTEMTEEEIIIAAGKIYYGQTLLEANSDVPNVVLVRVVSGPLKGWKLMGSFSVMDDIEMLAITFNVAVNDEGKQLPVRAVMLNPETSLPAMRTDVDHRYLRRILLPAAAAFIEGYAEAIGETETEVIIIGESAVTTEDEPSDGEEVALGIAEMGADIADIIDDLGDVPVRIKIDAGTPIGIFFTENVVDNDTDI